MSDRESKELTELYGTADLFALLSAAFAYPSLAFAQALVDGSYVSDMRSCLLDAGMSTDETDATCDAIEAQAKGKDAESLMHELRIEHTQLYYVPGKYRKIVPYESAFRRRALSPTAKATVFLTKSTHDVEALMRKYNAMPEDARTEPADSIDTELDFLRILYTGQAAAIVEDGDAAPWVADTRKFLDEHALEWMPGFFDKTIEVTELELYRLFAKLGLHVTQCVSTGNGA